MSDRIIPEPPGIVKSIDGLAELAARINAEHQQAEAALRAGLAHARTAGELLLQAKEQCRHGEWLPWLKANVRFSERTAQAYMRVAKRWFELESKAQGLADLTFEDGLKLLAGPTVQKAVPVAVPETVAGPIDALFAAAEAFDRDSTKLRNGELEPPFDPPAQAIKEACDSLAERLEAPDVTFTEAKAIRDAAEAVVLAAAEHNLRVERMLGKMMITPQLDPACAYDVFNGQNQLAELTPDPDYPGHWIIGVFQDIDTEGACVEYLERGANLDGLDPGAVLEKGWQFRPPHFWRSKPATGEKPWYVTRPGKPGRCRR
jgi:hypothetical protein